MKRGLASIPITANFSSPPAISKFYRRRWHACRSASRYAPEIERAALIWLDTAVDNLWLLLRQICEAVDILDQHDVVPHLLDIAEEAMRGLEWPSATAAYVARTAPASMQQKIWQLPPLEAAPEGLNQAERASVVSACETLLAQLTHTA